jgi:beta-1,2-rhamnosyltransferase WsaF-like protein
MTSLSPAPVDEELDVPGSARTRPTTLLRGVVRRVRRAVRRARRALRGEARKQPSPSKPVVPPNPASSPTQPQPEPPLIPAPEIQVQDAAGRTPELIVLLPSLELAQLTGGPNTALHLGARVAARGIPVRFVATHGNVEATSGALAAHLARLAGGTGRALPVSFESVLGTGRHLRLARHDTVVATWWPTAYLADAAIERAGAPDFVYLIQDFEPAFYPWSTNYALAEATYSMPIRAIFNSGLVHAHFVAAGIGRFKGESNAPAAIAFEPAVDATLYRPRPRSGRRRLLFYARPSKPRNLFPLGLRALREAADGGTFRDWDLRSIGEHVPDQQLGGGAVLRPTPWRDIKGYAKLLGTSDVLLSLMLSPHPSYPPLEMAASGGVVVTNTFGVKTAEELARISPRIRAVEPEVGALAAALRGAVATPRDASPPQFGLPGSWDIALEPVIDWVLAEGFARRG